MTKSRKFQVEREALSFNSVSARHSGTLLAQAAQAAQAQEAASATGHCLYV